MRYIILLMLLGSSFILKGQEFEGRIELYGDQYIVSDAITINDSENYITFQSNIDYNLKDFEKSKIRSIQRKEGSYFVTGLLIGAAAGPLLYHYVRGYDNYSFESFALTNAIGIVFGSVLGAITNKYVQIYGDMDTRLAVLEKVEVMPGTFQFIYTLINYSVKF